MAREELQRLASARARMVEEQVAARGVRDPLVLKALRDVPREWFVSEEERHRAFADSPLPIEEGQTISQPYVVALMAELARLEPSDKVLEVGTGSGYAAAVLAAIASEGEVYTIERHGTLAATASLRLEAHGFSNVHIRVGDGSLGWPEAAPFDAIVVAAASPQIPASLVAQLADGARLVLPVGSRDLQSLTIVTRRGVRLDIQDQGAVRFVPLVGEQGWTRP